MRTESREIIVIEAPNEVYDLDLQVEEGQRYKFLAFELPDSQRPTLEEWEVKDAISEAFGTALWSDLPCKVRVQDTAMCVTSAGSVSGSIKLGAMVADTDCLPLVASAMGVALRAKIMETRQNPLVWMRNWPITAVRGNPRFNESGYGGWKLSVRGYLCTEQQAAAAKVIEDQWRKDHAR